MPLSPAAEYAQDEFEKCNLWLHESTAIGFEKVIREELAEVWEECREPDWDGYDALPVSRETVQNAQTLLRSLPFGTEPPSVGAIPNGGRILGVRPYGGSRTPYPDAPAAGRGTSSIFRGSPSPGSW